MIKFIVSNYLIDKVIRLERSSKYRLIDLNYYCGLKKTIEVFYILAILSKIIK